MQLPVAGSVRPFGVAAAVVLPTLQRNVLLEQVHRAAAAGEEVAPA